MADPTADDTRQQRRQRARYRRARVRNFLFTAGPHRLTGGRITRRHLAQDVEIREVEVVAPDWPRAFDGIRIGHVSDFHLGDLLPLERALEVVELLAEQEPDLVACTGDVVDLHHDEAGPLLEALAAIDAPLGSALVLGNHDELHCAESISSMAVEAGLTLLRNEAFQVTRGGEHLVVAGVDWARSGVRCRQLVDRTCGCGEAHLLLAHNPRAFRRAVQLGIPLTLSGHTHGGQVAAPNRPNANLAATQRHSSGLYRRRGCHLYVTTGVAPGSRSA